MSLRRAAAGELSRELDELVSEVGTSKKKSKSKRNKRAHATTEVEVVQQEVNMQLVVQSPIQGVDLLSASENNVVALPMEVEESAAVIPLTVEARVKPSPASKDAYAAVLGDADMYFLGTLFLGKSLFNCLTFSFKHSSPKLTHFL
jgi:hypothetical protein